jgi:hypothetical protein
MGSRLLAQLDAAIVRARANPIEQACLRAERAALLSRQGRGEEAAQQLQQIHREFAQRPAVAVSGWLSLAEGQLSLYGHLGRDAHDKFQRAHALSRAGRLQALQALSAAWLAHSAESRGEAPLSAALCAEAWRLAAADHHAARWRAALTIAGGYHYAGRLERAQAWYAAARRHAMALGDEVAISALMHNQTTIRISHARMATAFDGEGLQVDEPLSAMGAESTLQFDAVIGLQSLEWLVPIIRAQLLVHQGRFQEALDCFDREWDRAEPGWLNRMGACLQADRAWCLWHTGHRVEALAQAQQAADSLTTGPCEIDDRALALSRLGQLSEAAGQLQQAALHRQRALQDWQAHRAAQERVVALLDESLADLSPR